MASLSLRSSCLLVKVFLKNSSIAGFVTFAKMEALFLPPAQEPTSDHDSTADNLSTISQSSNPSEFLASLQLTDSDS
ncbi:hypothetical protein TorRG33x02_270720 [Trema orientale]|uniref:Uncharacterized protein n=1 Tax=Trema orientale TaxID=63057 RepID=A0A2P5CWR4_TREOI|nr:hypothetical protein TorRG33x02_270720 [Trema orientale]